MHLLSTIVPLLATLPAALSVTTLHYYKITSCNTGTDVGVYDAPITDTATDSSCHPVTGSSPAKALYINGLDTDCAVVAYTSTSCDTGSSGTKLAMKGDCFYLDGAAVIGSWKAVCGQALVQAKAALSGSTTASATANATAGNATSAAASGSVSATARSGAGALGVGVGLVAEILVLGGGLVWMGL